jgi:hypothetical protein
MRSFSDTLGQVFRAIMANKLRSFLTMFGIAWGVGSLLVLVGLGEGFREGQHKQLSQFGNDVVMVQNGTIPALANQHTGMRPYELTLGDEDAIRRLPESAPSPPSSPAPISTKSASGATPPAHLGGRAQLHRRPLPSHRRRPLSR